MSPKDLSKYIYIIDIGDKNFQSITFHLFSLNMKKYVDKNVNDVNIKIGDKILVKNDAGHKLDNNYIGPFTVIEVDNHNNCTIKDKNKLVKINKSRIKPFQEFSQPFSLV